MNQRAAIFFVCLLIAITFWFVTSMSRNYETVLHLPVSYRNLPFTQNIEGELPKEISFYYRGTGFELFGLHIRQNPDSIIVDISAAQKKNGQISLSTDSLRKQFKGDLQPYKIIPTEIAPALAARTGKKVPVKLNARIKYRDRFQLKGKIILRPDSIDIAGPEEMLSQIKFVETEKIELKDIHTDHFGGVNLVQKPRNGIQISQPYIHYFIPVVEFTEGSVEIPVILPVSKQNQITLIPSKVKVTYMVELKDYNSIKAGDFVAYADLPQTDRFPSSLEIKLQRKPYKVTNVKISPQFVDYLVKK